MQCTISYSIYKVRPQTTFSHRKASCFIYSALILKLISYNIMASLSHFLIITVLFIVPFFSCCVNAQLSANFYARTCPTLPTIVRNAMRQAVSREGRMAASILRLFFHDCFVNVRIYSTKIFSCHTTYICWLITGLIFSYMQFNLIHDFLILPINCRVATLPYCWTTRPPSQAKRMRSQTRTQLGALKWSTPLKPVWKQLAVLLYHAQIF